MSDGLTEWRAFIRVHFHLCACPSLIDCLPLINLVPRGPADPGAAPAPRLLLPLRAVSLPAARVFYRSIHHCIAFHSDACVASLLYPSLLLVDLRKQRPGHAPAHAHADVDADARHAYSTSARRSNPNLAAKGILIVSISATFSSKSSILVKSLLYRTLHSTVNY